MAEKYWCKFRWYSVEDAGLQGFDVDRIVSQWGAEAVVVVTTHRPNKCTVSKYHHLAA
jgi:hypothetical protein